MASRQRLGLDRLEESPIDWEAWFERNEIHVAAPKQLLPHQKDALEAVRAGFEDADRGKLIIACGTGKTFTGLKIAKNLVGVGGQVLVLVPCRPCARKLCVTVRWRGPSDDDGLTTKFELC